MIETLYHAGAAGGEEKSDDRHQCLEGAVPKTDDKHVLEGEFGETQSLADGDRESVHGKADA